MSYFDKPIDFDVEEDDELILVPARFIKIAKQPQQEKIVDALWRGDWY
jgi:hypothetical protein